MVRLLTRRWFDRHPLKEFSAARYQYSLMLNEGFEEQADKLIREHGLDNPLSAKYAQAIGKEEDLKELLRWMKRTVSGQGALLLRDKVLKREEEALPEIKRMLLTTGSDPFVENAIRLLKRFRENPAPWLLEHYGEIRYPYARSSMCLVLGFRADESAVPFLIAQVEEMEKNWPKENYAQAPLLALYELKARFGEA